MKAILINPQDKTISEVEHNGDFHQIYELIEASCFDCVRINSRETIYVDDEGLINGKAQTVGMFRVAGDYPTYLAGKALILSTDGAGESAGTEFTTAQIADMIDFGTPIRLGDRMGFIGDKNAYPMD